MRLLYRFSGPLTNKVIHSQVVGTLEALRREGLRPDLLAWCGLGHALRHPAAYRQAEQAIRRHLAAPFRIRHTVDRWGRLDRMLKRRELESTLARVAAERVLLQTRSPDMALLMAGLRREDARLRLVIEIRGDLRAERGYRREADAGLATLEDSLQRALEAADLALCVTEELARRVAERHGVPASRLHVMPCTADEELFCPDAASRERRRRELGLRGEDLLLVYSGSLAKGWDVPERIGSFLRANMARQARLHALLLSPDAPAAVSLAGGLPRGRAHVRSPGHWEMPGWLCAGDAALLLRDPHPLNEVASPTKAAELLLCGLPLLISPGVGDYSGWVEERGLGLLVSGEALPERDWERLRALDPRGIRRQALELVARTPHVHRLAQRLRAL